MANCNTQQYGGFQDITGCKIALHNSTADCNTQIAIHYRIQIVILQCITLQDTDCNTAMLCTILWQIAITILATIITLMTLLSRPSWPRPGGHGKCQSKWIMTTNNTHHQTTTPPHTTHHHTSHNTTLMTLIEEAQ